MGWCLNRKSSLVLLLGALLAVANAGATPACAPLFEGLSPAGAVALVAGALPVDEAGVFRALAEPFLALPVIVTRGNPRIVYRNRLVDWSVRRSRTASLRWNFARGPIDRERSIESTIDLVTEAAFVPVRRTSILLRRPRTFLSANLELMTQKLRFKLFTLKPIAEPPSKFDALAGAVVRTVRPFLPTQFAVLRSMKLTAAHVAAFDAGGPRGLYDHLKRREGFELALRYWGTHLTNVQLVLTAAYAATILPGVLEAWNYVLGVHALNARAPGADQYRALARLFGGMP